MLYLKLDDHNWIIQDYTDIDALGITGTVYSDAKLTIPFDITGYTLSFRLKSQGKMIFDSDQDSSVSIVTAASGTFKYLPEYGDMLIEANAEASLLMEKSGTEITAVGINSSADLHVQIA